MPALLYGNHPINYKTAGLLYSGFCYIQAQCHWLQYFCEVQTIWCNAITHPPVASPFPKHWQELHLQLSFLYFVEAICCCSPFYDTAENESTWCSCSFLFCCGHLLQCYNSFPVYCTPLPLSITLTKGPSWYLLKIQNTQWHERAKLQCYSG